MTDIGVLPQAAKAKSPKLKTSPRSHVTSGPAHPDDAMAGPTGAARVQGDGGMLGPNDGPTQPRILPMLGRCLGLGRACGSQESSARYRERERRTRLPDECCGRGHFSFTQCSQAVRREASRRKSCFRRPPGIGGFVHTYYLITWILRRYGTRSGKYKILFSPEVISIYEVMKSQIIGIGICNLKGTK